MSESITVHMQGACELSDICDSIEEVLRHDLVPSDKPASSMQGSTLGLLFSVYESAEFDDDCGIPFSEYRFVVSIDVCSDVIDPLSARMFQELAAGVIMRFCCHQLRCRGIVVRNLQHLVASFPGDAAANKAVNPSGGSGGF